jgi:hypothetical protein
MASTVLRPPPPGTLAPRPGRRHHDRRAGAYAATMATKSRPTAEPKKPGKSLKEKRAAKHEKQAAQKQARSAK